MLCSILTFLRCLSFSENTEFQNDCNAGYRMAISLVASNHSFCFLELVSLKYMTVFLGTVCVLHCFFY